MDMSEALEPPGLARKRRIEAEVARRRMKMQQEKQAAAAAGGGGGGGGGGEPSSSSSRHRQQQQQQQQQHSSSQHSQHRRSNGGGGGAGGAAGGAGGGGAGGEGRVAAGGRPHPSMHDADADAMDDWLQMYLKRKGLRQYVDPRAETKNQGFRALSSQQYGGVASVQTPKLSLNSVCFISHRQ